MHSIDLDAVLDFVIEHVDDKELYRFQDIASILNWLNGIDATWNGQHRVNPIECQQGNDTAMPILRPGTKITIPKPSASDIKFTDMESVKAYLNQGPANQSNDDSEEVDVTTFDFTPTWNQYHNTETKPKSRKTTKLHRVLTEKQPTANGTNTKPCYPKKGAIKSTDHRPVETIYKCMQCDKKYKQKSSLHRHEKSHLPKEPGNVINSPAETKPHNPSKKNINSNALIIPLNTVETISTWIQWVKHWSLSIFSSFFAKIKITEEKVEKSNQKQIPNYTNKSIKWTWTYAVVRLSY